MTNNDLKQALRDAKSQLQAAETDLEELQQQVKALEDAVEAAEGDEGISKRDIAKAAWVAPIVLATNLPNSVFAQNAVSPVNTPKPNQPTPKPGKPTPKPNQPTPKPTPRPTPKPTLPAPTPNAPTPSDARLKREVERVATLDNGVQLYAYKYLWSETSYVGVMAQDLLSDGDRKDAVSTTRGGHYAVDYGKLGLKIVTLEEWRKHGIKAVRT